MIIDNDIFWNNFNYHAGQAAVRGADGRHRGARARSAPASCCSAARATGSRTTASTATTWPAWPRSRASSWTKTPEARTLANNVIQGNQFGLNGTDVNGVDFIYDGNGTNNCFSMAGVTSTFPADGSTFAGCGGAERVQQGRLRTRCSAGPARARCRPGTSTRTRPSRGSTRSRSSAVKLGGHRAPASRSWARRRRYGAAKKTIKIGDNYYSPKTRHGQARHDRHVAVARLRRGGRRARRQAQVRPQGREEVPVRGRLDGLLVQAQADRRRARTRSSAPSTRTWR